MNRKNSVEAARTASLALGRSPYSKGAEKLAAALEKPMDSTPKRWELRGLGTGDDLTIHDLDTDNGDTVATVPLTGDHEYDRDVVTANAHLLASAPALLEALEGIIALPMDDYGDRIIPRGFLDEARAALTLATGGAK